jgi:tetratricopeptide (TPR) repeat protein
MLLWALAAAAVGLVFWTSATMARDTVPIRPRAAARKGVTAGRWEVSRHDGLEALQEKRYADAERLLKQAVAEAEELGPDRSELATALDSLGIYYMIRDHDAEADQLLTRALAIEEKASGPESVEVSESLEHLAWIRTERKQYESAEGLARRAVAIREKHAGPDDPESAGCLEIVSAILFLKGELDKAEPFWARSLTIQEKVHEPDSVAVARTLQNKAVILLGRAQSAQMKALFKGLEGLAADRPEANPVPHAGDALNLQAEHLLERVLAIREKAQGANHEAYRETLDYLVYSLQSRGDRARARRLMERSLAVREQALGPDHAEVASALASLADDHMDHGEYRQAEPLLRRALAFQHKVPGAAGDDARKNEEYYAAQLQKAVRSAAVLEDPARQPTEADLKYLNGLAIGSDAPDVMTLFNRTWLIINDNRLDDAGLSHIRGLINLESLDVRGRFTDAGLAHIERLTNLKELSLHERVEIRAPDNPFPVLSEIFMRGPIAETIQLARQPPAEAQKPPAEPPPGITDAGLAHLEPLAHLEQLTIFAPGQIHDAGLAHLASLDALERLILIGADVHGPGLVHLRKLTQLRELNLANTPLDDAGLAQLAPLTSLQTLNIADTKVSDGGLVHLRKLTGLRELDAAGTEVTDAGIKELMRVLPELKASREEQPLLSPLRALQELEPPK